MSYTVWEFSFAWRDMEIDELFLLLLCGVETPVMARIKMWIKILENFEKFP